MSNDSVSGGSVSGGSVSGGSVSGGSVPNGLAYAAFSYHMPTKIFAGPLTAYANEFAGYGKRALIVTGKSSASNGALNDVLSILQGLQVEAVVFDRVEENPSLANVVEAAQAGRRIKADFVIGIGGGSPLDAAKAAALLLNRPGTGDSTNDGTGNGTSGGTGNGTGDAGGVDGDNDGDGEILYDTGAFPQGAKPILAIPTTAGTGSEVTPYAVLTRHSQQTKMTIPYTLFPQKAFLNPAYTATMSDRLTLHTAVDALCHLAEGYLSARANVLSDALAEGGLAAFGDMAQDLAARRFDAILRERLLTISALAGMVIAQTKTSLPHQLGYALTYHKHIPHGAACGFLLPGFLRFHENKKKTSRCLSLLGLSDEDALRDWLFALINVNAGKQGADLEETDIQGYVQTLTTHPERLSNHPYPVTASDLTTLYKATTNPPRLA